MILHTSGQASVFAGNILGKVTIEPIPVPSRRADYVLVTDRVTGIDLTAYAAILTSQGLSKSEVDAIGRQVPVIHTMTAFDIFRPGQVVVMNGNTGFVRILFRPDSRFNYILATERCNSRCLMCSQPPRDVDDSDRISEHLRLIDLMDENLEFLGITGGEPTLLNNDFFRLIQKCRERLPSTHVHVLTNGRLFHYEDFARRLADIGHRGVTLGIPLYSDNDREHDFVVQARGAFDQTTVGLCNLARYNQNVELRVVVHALTYRQLPRLARYIYHNFSFVAHIALMGLEITGYTRPNLKMLWVDPVDYQDELEEAVNILANRSMSVSIYNHQLCVLRKSLWPFARKSISDWKNIYFEECDDCVLRRECGGFFASAARRRSAHIQAFKLAPQ